MNYNVELLREQRPRIAMLVGWARLGAVIVPTASGACVPCFVGATYPPLGCYPLA